MCVVAGNLCTRLLLRVNNARLLRLQQITDVLFLRRQRKLARRERRVMPFAEQ